MRIKVISIISFFFFSFSSLAEVNLDDQVSFSIGMVSLGLSQNSSAFAEDAEVSSGSVSGISLDLNYEIFSKPTDSHGFKVTTTGVLGGITKYYALGYNRRYYLGGHGTTSSFFDPKMNIKIYPDFRYYLGFLINAISVVYETADEVRSDIGIEIGANAGMAFGGRTGNAYRFELDILKGTGVETSGIGFQVFFGTSFFVDSIL